MGIRISSVQSRDQVDIKSMPQPDLQTVQMPDPIPKDLGENMRGYADFIEKKEREALRNARNIRNAMVKNKFSDFETAATLKVLDAQGENTFKAGDEAGKELKKNLEKEMQKLPAESRAEYSNFANDSIQRFNKTAQGRMITEGRKAGEESFKKSANDITSRTVLNAYDPNLFEVGLQELDQITEAHSQLTIGDESPRAKELTEIHKREARSTVILKTVETLAASGDTQKANEIAQQYKDTLSAGDLTKAYKLLSDGKKKKDLDSAKALSDSAFGTFGDDEISARKFISESTTDGQLASDALSMYSANAAAKVRSEKRQRKETFGEVQSKILKTGRMSPEDMAKLDPQDLRAAFELQGKVSRGELIPRNNAVWNRMLEMYVDEPSRFARQTFTDLQHQLPNTDMNTLFRLRDKLLEPTAEKFKPASFSYILNKALATVTAKPGSQKRVQEQAALRDIYVTAFNNAQASLGERGTQADMAKAIEEEMALKTQRMSDNRTLWDKITFKPVDMQPQPSPAQKGAKKFNTNATPPTLDKYTPSDRKRLQDEFRKRFKREITTVELLRALSKLRDQGNIQTLD